MYNLKRFIGYLTYTGFIGLVVIQADNYHQYLIKTKYITYDLRPFWLFMSVFPIIIGFLIGLPPFFKELQHNGSWNFDWPFFLAVGVPSLCVTLSPITYLAESPRTWKLIGLIVQYHPNLITVAGIIFGISLVTSIRKKNY